jgi:MOB kinase activator 1
LNETKTKLTKTKQEIVELGEEAHLNTSFKHFYLFVHEFDLVDKKELVPMQFHIDKITEKLQTEESNA